MNVTTYLKNVQKHVSNFRKLVVFNCNELREATLWCWACVLCSSFAFSYFASDLRGGVLALALAVIAIKCDCNINMFSAT